jgi:hypothetical protein
MEHVVFYPGADAAPAFRRFASLDEAVRFVEHLRNTEGVAEVSVHALVEVPLAFRAYYKVEVPVGEAVREPETVVQDLVPDQVPAPVESVADLPPMEVVEEQPVAMATMGEPDVASNGKRSLGFFSH